MEICKRRLARKRDTIGLIAQLTLRGRCARVTGPTWRADRAGWLRGVGCPGAGKGLIFEQVPVPVIAPHFRSESWIVG